jgi:hypothetical protein
MCTKLRITNTLLDLEAKIDLMDLYSKIYGATSITINEFVGWLMKGYIGNLKKRKVNWALEASMAALKKVD